MVIVSGNTKKGGCGKSTVATNLAADLSRNGQKVKVLDLDPENTASKDFFEARKDNKIKCEVIDTAENLLDALEPHIINIIDIGGIESDLTATAVAMADILFIPFRMSKKDLKALGSFIAWLEGLFTDEDEARMFLVPNFVGTDNHAKDRVKKDLQPLVDQGYPIGSILSNRISYMNSDDEGQSVTEYGDMKAAAEIRPLVVLSVKATLDAAVRNQA